MLHCSISLFIFFFNDTATTEIYTLSLHDALRSRGHQERAGVCFCLEERLDFRAQLVVAGARSEEHTSELQSRGHLVCRLLLEKKKNNQVHSYHPPDNAHLHSLFTSIVQFLYSLA